jgi:TRAP-type mannitol/chloroaromatic compound transport system permease small subunit
MDIEPSAAGAPAGGVRLARAFIRPVETAIDLIGRGAAWLTLAIVVLMAVDVLLRYAFSIGSVWAQELEWHLLAPMVLFGMTYALLKGEHVRVDVLYAHYPPKGQALVDLVSALLAVAMAVLVIRYSIQFVSQSYAINEISSDPGGLPRRWMLKALIPIGFGVFAVMAASQGVGALLRLMGVSSGPQAQTAQGAQP